ncbi:MAG: hypothetical protein H0T17_09740 [Propionibacteriales bacterium]|nr:hypothetical protein [Propionibacteriales bacterium]
MITAVLFAYEPEDVKPGWVALVLVLLLAIATFLLWRNMNKQLRKIDVPTRAEIDAAAAKDSSDPAAPGDPDLRDEDHPPGS